MALRSLAYPAAFVALVAAGRLGRQALDEAPHAKTSRSAAPVSYAVASVAAERPPPAVDLSALPEPAEWPHLNPEADLRTAWLLAEGPAHRPGDGHRYVTFTFDDGPFPETTPAVLKVLAQHHLHATFFFLGRYLDGDDDRAARTREVARQVLAEGHLVGNHTEDHRLLTTATPVEVIAQIEDGARAIESATGVRPVFFRPPYGQLDADGQAYVARQGLELMLWSVEAHDMLVDDVDEMTQSIEEQIARGGDGVVLLHDIRPATAEVLTRVLTWLDARAYRASHPDQLGYEAVDLPTYLHLLALSPPQVALKHEPHADVAARANPSPGPRRDEM